MKQLAFYLGYFLSPLFPSLLYANSLNSSQTPYILSVVLGVYAFTLICNMFYLASKPTWILKLFGDQWVHKLHGSSTLFILLLGGFHFFLKLTLGYALSKFQAIIGLVSFVLLMVGTTVAIGFHAGKTNIPSKAFSKFHSLMGFIGLVLLLHVQLASTSAFSTNPWGRSILIVWMLYTLLSYLDHRLRNAKHTT